MISYLCRRIAAIRDRFRWVNYRPLYSLEGATRHWLLRGRNRPSEYLVGAPRNSCRARASYRPPGGGRSASPIELLGGRRGGGRRLLLFLVLVGGGGGLVTLRRRGINSSLILF